MNITVMGDEQGITKFLALINVDNLEQAKRWTMDIHQRVGRMTWLGHGFVVDASRFRPRQLKVF